MSSQGNIHGSAPATTQGRNVIMGLSVELIIQIAVDTNLAGLAALAQTSSWIRQVIKGNAKHICNDMVRKQLVECNAAGFFDINVGYNQWITPTANILQVFNDCTLELGAPNGIVHPLELAALTDQSPRFLYLLEQQRCHISFCSRRIREGMELHSAAANVDDSDPNKHKSSVELEAQAVHKINKALSWGQEFLFSSTAMNVVNQEYPRNRELVWYFG